LRAGFYARSVHDVARDLVGCVVRHGETAGRIVEVESYHEEEPACHAFVGLTPRTEVLFGSPGSAYVYLSYGIHALLNAVAEREGVGAAVLIRALEPVEGLDLMRARRGLDPERMLCSGPGKLTQALGIGLDLNGTSLVDGGGPIEILARTHEPEIVADVRIGITKAIDLPWRFCDATRADYVSKPLPAALRRVAA
jgi:DNA-3-methyladenine glycosylase